MVDPLRPLPILYFEQKIVLTDPKPISINEAYTVARGRQILTNDGRRFKDALKFATSRATTGWGVASHAVYELAGWVDFSITMYLARIYNESWKPGSRTEKGTPRNPYQKIDASNYIKLLEDAVVMGCGIDDANHMDIHIYKREDKERPRIEVEYKVFVT